MLFILNNFNIKKNFRLFYLGVDGVEICSELNLEVKKELINKIRSLSTENNQYIPIVHNLCYFRAYLKSIYSLDKNNIVNNNLNANNQITVNENQNVYFFKCLEDILDFFMTRNSQEFFENEEKFQLISPHIQPNQDLIDLSAKIIYSNLPNFYDIGNKQALNSSAPQICPANTHLEFSASENCSDTISASLGEDKGFKLLSSITNSSDKSNNNKNSNKVNDSSNPYSENQYLKMPIKLDQILSGDFSMRFDAVLLCTEPALNFKSFQICDIIHINFGEVTFTVEETSDKFIRCLCRNTGAIKLGQSFSVESKDHFLSNLIENDENKLLKELKDSIDLQVDFIVMSVIKQPKQEIE